MQSSLRVFLASALALGWLVNGACRWGQKEYSSIPANDLAAYVATMSDPQQRQIAQSPQIRKQMIDEFKKRYAFAQASIGEGLDKTEDFTRNYALTMARLLTQEHSKRNPDFQVGKPEIDAYVAAHQKEFNDDVAYFTKRNKQPVTPDQMEGYKASWGELEIRADKARQAKIDKEPAIQLQLKLIRAELLANLYSSKLQKQFEPTEADYQSYYQQHPEADPEKIKQHMTELLARIKKGEAFEKIADEVNDDGTKGRGGDLDCFGKGTMDPDFEKAAFALQPGQISQEPVKSSFGYHLVKVEGPCKDENKSAAANPGSAAAKPGPNAEQIHAKHIYLSTKVAEEVLAQQVTGKVKRAMEDATLKYPVSAPEDFKVNVAGLRPLTGTPPPGSGLGGTMKMITPNP